MFAERHGIKNPKKLTMEEIEEGLRCCKMKQREAREKSHPMREDHLLERLKEAILRNNKKAVAHIKQIINGEKSRKN